MAVHPKCGKTIPGGNSGGHCAGCCESFRGDQAFDQHFRRHDDGRIECIHPSEAVGAKTGKPKPYWQDERGIWHYGDRNPLYAPTVRP